MTLTTDTNFTVAQHNSYVLEHLKEGSVVCSPPVNVRRSYNTILPRVSEYEN